MIKRSKIANKNYKKIALSARSSPAQQESAHFTMMTKLFVRFA